MSDSPVAKTVEDSSYSNIDVQSKESGPKDAKTTRSMSHLRHSTDDSVMKKKTFQEMNKIYESSPNLNLKEPQTSPELLSQSNFPSVSGAQSEMRLLHVKRDSVNIGGDISMIKNRVNQLERLEQRMLKKIDKTRKEAELIIQVKEKNQEKYDRQRYIYNERIAEVEEKKMINKERRSATIQSIYNSKNIFKQGVVENAKVKKQVSTEMQQRRRYQNVYQAQEKQAQAAGVKIMLAQGQKKIRAQSQMQLESYQRQYHNRVASHASINVDKIKKLESLEQVEKQLIDRLQLTQKREKDVLQNLDQVLLDQRQTSLERLQNLAQDRQFKQCTTGIAHKKKFPMRFSTDVVHSQAAAEYGFTQKNSSTPLQVLNEVDEIMGSTSKSYVSQNNVNATASSVKNKPNPYSNAFNPYGQKNALRIKKPGQIYKTNLIAVKQNLKNSNSKSEIRQDLNLQNDSQFIAVSAKSAHSPHQGESQNGTTQ